MASSGRLLLEQLLTEDLSGVTFVRDYLQLQFNPPPLINVYSRCLVRAGGQVASFGEEPFANLLISLIGRRVMAVDDDHERFVISLEGNAVIEIPFGAGAFNGPEAFEFWGREHKWGVWPG